MLMPSPGYWTKRRGVREQKNMIEQATRRHPKGSPDMNIVICFNVIFVALNFSVSGLSQNIPLIFV